MGLLPGVRRREFERITGDDVIYGRQTADTLEQFVNLSRVAVPNAFVDLDPAIYDLGFTAMVGMRISGSGTNKIGNTRITLKQSAFGVSAVPNTDPSLDDATRWVEAFIPNTGLGNNAHSSELYLPRVRIEAPTRLHMHFAKNETGATGSVGARIFATASIEGGTQTRYSSAIHQPV